MKLEHSMQQWCKTHPQITDYFIQLNRKDVRWAIFAGTSVSLLTGNRTPTDVDIIVHDDDFRVVREFTLGAKTKIPMDLDLSTGDGKTLHFSAHELAFDLDGTEIEVMSRCRLKIESSVYDIAFTAMAVDNRISVVMPQTTIYIANPFDTIAIKAIMQRGSKQNKFDFEDAEALISKYVIPEAYMGDRSREIGLDGRPLGFIRKAGLLYL